MSTVWFNANGKHCTHKSIIPNPFCGGGHKSPCFLYEGMWNNIMIKNMILNNMNSSSEAHICCGLDDTS